MVEKSKERIKMDLLLGEWGDELESIKDHLVVSQKACESLLHATDTEDAYNTVSALDNVLLGSISKVVDVLEEIRGASHELNKEEEPQPVAGGQGS